MPEGADTVVPVEDTERIDDAGGSIRIRSVPSPRQNVRYMGEHIRPGTTVFLGGELLTPPAIGMLATLGVDQVGVRRRPTVAIVATGDELVEPGETLEPGKIRNSNGPALAAQTRAAGAEVRAVLLARDTPGDLERCLDSALQHDVVVLSGGVSVGEHDHVKDTLVRRGVDLLFWKVRQKPGKPLAFGKGPRSIVFGLPGNPVSSSVCFDQYVRPAILSMMGRREVLRKLVPARLVSAVRKRKGLYHFVRATATFESGSIGVQPTGPQGSNLYTSMLDAECLIHLPEEVEDPAPGTLVEVEWLTW